ncbi:unnamed protein product [Soboliphyme baturini]|uniref:Protein quiver n=1 Tax=Soboliphyme baturini TaxID=241478 RepID=A0A183IR05_9BILA|nr:unnamed protein product [Soboliphyme baturini]
MCPTLRYLPSEKYLIEKGCLRSTSADLIGCAYRRSMRHVYCICASDDFCNESASAGNGSKREQKLSVQCRECYTWKSCLGICHADYCWAEAITGAEQCGYGVPFLPYHYQTPSLLSLESNHNACVRIEFSGQLQVKRFFECICSGHNCNGFSKSVSKFQPLSSDRPLVTCYSCSHSSTVPFRRTVCRQNTCRGQFCFLSIENANVPSGLHAQTSGCLNSTIPSHVVLGCRHNWILDQRERVECVCTKDLCNSEPSTLIMLACGILTHHE